MIDNRNWDAAARRREAWAATAFLTRLPVPRAAALEDGGLAAAGWAFPLVGAVIGLLGGLAFVLAARIGLPPMLDALIAVGVTIVATGALHEDGLADSADGLGARDPERALQIMRDSRIGVFGVLALLLSFALRSAALAAIAAPGPALWALVAAHAAARGLLPIVMRQHAPARADGLGAGAGRPTQRVALAALLIALGIAVLALGFVRGIAALAAAMLAVATAASLARRRLSGYTGDTLGAAEQIGEIVMLLGAVA